MKSRILVATALLLALAPAAAKEKEEKKDKESPVIATVNGEPVTKAQWAEIWKADQWHAPTLKLQSGFAEKMQGKPYEDYFFKEEVVMIRAMAQKYKESLPGMKASIDDIYQKVKDGADFGEMAKQMSQDSTAAAGGSMGEPKEFHEMVFPFNRVAMSLKAGEVSEPVLTIFGYHIMKVEKILPAGSLEGKGKRVDLRHILIRYPSTNPRKEAEDLASQAKVDVVDKGLCKKLVSYCPPQG